MTNRAGVLGLMLHSTYDHEYAAKVQKQHHQSLQTHQNEQPAYYHNDHQYFQKGKSNVSSSEKNHSYRKEISSSNSNQSHQNTQSISDHHYHRQQQSFSAANKEAVNRSTVEQPKRYYKITQVGSSGVGSGHTYSNKVNQHPSQQRGESSKISFTLLSNNKTFSLPKANERSNRSDIPVTHDHQYFTNVTTNTQNKYSDHIYSSKH